VTQHGSFPGRPRGRRARQDGDVPERAGYDDTPQDQREFPDLAPIRPREARARDARIQPDGQTQAGGYGYRDGGYAGQGSAGQGHPGFAQPGQGQAPWDDQPWQGQQPGAGEPAQAPQHRVAQPPQPQPQPQAQPQPKKDQEEDVPSWAEPDSVEAFSARWHRRGLDSREDRRSDRRRHRRLLIAGGGVLAVVVAVAAYFLTGSSTGSANLGFGSLVTTFLPGELQQVPDACGTVATGTLDQYLPGTRKQAAPPLNSGATTECTWTLDSPPTYRVLQVQLVAYSPSGLASGNGSATFAAEDAYQSFENGFNKPGPKSDQPTATVTDLSGMPGGKYTSAFQATQVFVRGGATSDVVNVLVRYRNVIVTVVVDGLDQTSGTKKYGPVSMSDLTAAATAAARDTASKIIG
jgi:hypothetical protein